MNKDRKEEENISDEVRSFERALNEKTTGEVFLQNIISRLDNFERLYGNGEYKTFSNDFHYIIQCSTNCLPSLKIDDQSELCIDAYFYILNRLKIYYEKQNKIRRDIQDAQKINQFKSSFTSTIADIFKSTAGAQPNLCTDQKKLLESFNVLPYLLSIKTLSEETIHLFFVVCKLAFQVAERCDENGSIQWKSTFQYIKTIAISLSTFVTHYKTYSKAFQSCPLDIDGFTFLISKTSTLPGRKSSLTTYYQLAGDLNLDLEKFWELFLYTFCNGIKQNNFDIKEVGELLGRLMGTYDHLFAKYLNYYYNYLSEPKATIWTVFYYLCTHFFLNENAVTNFIHYLSHYTQTLAPANLVTCAEDIKKNVVKFKAENLVFYHNAIEAVFADAVKNLYDLETRRRLPLNIDWNELLKYSLEIFATRTLLQPSNSLIIDRLLLYDIGDWEWVERVKELFKNFENFGEKLYERDDPDPATLIDDKKLQHLLVDIGAGFCLLLNKKKYKQLCDTYKENRWTNFIWSRIMHLSTIQSISQSTHSMLETLNKWIHDVEQDTFDHSHKLTVILVSNIFEQIIKHIGSVFSLPDIPYIIDFIFHLKDQNNHAVNNEDVNDFMTRGQNELENIILFKSKRSFYETPYNSSTINCFIRTMDFKKISENLQLPQYIFPSVSLNIQSMVSVTKPADIDITKMNSEEEIFDKCIRKGKEWFTWFDRFFDIFEYPIQWFEDHKVDGAHELLAELNTIKDKPTISLLEIKQVAEKILKLLKELEQLARFCRLFKCSTTFDNIEPGTTDGEEGRDKFITEMQTSHRDSKLAIDPNTGATKSIVIDNRQRVEWSLASENYSCNIKIEYMHANGSRVTLYDKVNVPVDKRVLYGEFETKKSGYLLITIFNAQKKPPQKVWFRVIATDLAKCHIFNGIFDIFYQKHYQKSKQKIKEHQLNDLLNQTFSFIDKLLTGTIEMKDMSYLKTIFCDKNIVVQDEVRGLIMNRSAPEPRRNPNVVAVQSQIPTDAEIQKVCEWIQTYQYYSHLNNIIECIEVFDIIPKTNKDQSIKKLEQLRNNESFTLCQITDVYKSLKERLQRLSSSHLQLIRTMLECISVVTMMKENNLYSVDGRHRFQELRDNLTTQFQLQERNNLILNSLIMAYNLCEPFSVQATSFDHFVDRLTKLPKVNDNSLKPIKVINENIQIVTMWLSTEVLTVLDNALVTMEYLYKTGTVTVHLNRLINEQSYFDIEYFIDKIQTSMNQTTDELNVKHEETTKIKFNLPMADIDDHKRQLTFCNIDLQDNMAHTKVLLDEQLNLLKVIERIYSLLIKLEVSGHPNYQLKEEKFEIFDQTGDINRALASLKNEPKMNVNQLKNIIQKQTKNLELSYQILENRYKLWLVALEQSRDSYRLLKLFTNRQIMIMIILLTKSVDHRKTKHHLLKILSSFDNINVSEENEVTLTNKYLTHYFQSLRFTSCDLSAENINRLCMKHKIESINNDSEFLNRLALFLRELFDNGNELFAGDTPLSENQQYLVTINQLEDQSSFKHSLDLKTCSILLNIFHNRLPAYYQILWCSTATKEDIELFFSRVRTFYKLTYVVMDIDVMHHKFREKLLHEQNLLSQQQEVHGCVYYFSKEITNCRNDLQPFHFTHEHQNSDVAYNKVNRLFESYNIQKPEIEIVCGDSGVGKTHFIKMNHREAETLCFSINDKLNLSLLTTALLSHDTNALNTNPSIYFNISIHALFDELTRILFSLFICGTLLDPHSGFTFSLLSWKSWKFIMEIPYTKNCGLTPKQNLSKILPILSIISPSNMEEVTDANYELSIGIEEELVARFLKAYENGSINRILTYDTNKTEYPVIFDKLDDVKECREHIYDCINKHALEIRTDKISQISFLKFLYRRVRFFTGHYYQMNDSNRSLGSVTMKQMISEAKSLARINFQTSNYPRLFLVYDPSFSLHVLHDGWHKVPEDIKTIFTNGDPANFRHFQNQDYYAICLSWLIDIDYKDFIKIMNETKFILTENFTYKIFHVHERKLTKLPLIIEGETGVGKTFLLKFYSLLLNAKTMSGSFEENIAPRIVERTNLWFLKTVLTAHLERDVSLLNTILEQIRPVLEQYGEAIVNTDATDNSNDSDEEENDENVPMLCLNADLMEEYNEVIERPMLEVAEELPAVEPEHIENNTLEALVAEGEIERHPVMAANQAIPKLEQVTDRKLLEKIKKSLSMCEYDHNILRSMWKIIITVSNEKSNTVCQKLLEALYEYVTMHLMSFPLIESSIQLCKLLEQRSSSNIETSIRIFDEYLRYTKIKPTFYRLLLHPGVTEEQLEQFLSPIAQLARELPDIVLVVFFDEVNTSSCLGLFKEIFIDRTMHGIDLPDNIFFTGAINPATNKVNTSNQVVHRMDYIVHSLPESLNKLKVSYGILESKILDDYINKKIATFSIESGTIKKKSVKLDNHAQDILSKSILKAQEFCEKRLGHNSVSQREVQRCFNLIEFFYNLKYKNDTSNDDDDDDDHDNEEREIKFRKSIALSLSLIYYFRLPTNEDNLQRKDETTPSRENFNKMISAYIPNFTRTIEEELVKFVNTDNFVIPQGVAINQAIREHIFAIVVSIVTRTPLCIIGAPGQSKTLSFQIVLQNLKGAELSTKPFCKRLPSIDPFFCLGSQYTRSEDIAYAFERAIKREQGYIQNRIATQCVVFLDEASLPDENKMVLKVLHPYLDECKVAFVAVANSAFDAANANRMICVYRSLPSENDQKILAYGCLGLQIKSNENIVNGKLENIIVGLCQGYRRVTISPEIPNVFHDRDFIYMLRELRFQLKADSSDENVKTEGITPSSLLRALEDNFNGIKKEEFDKLVDIFFTAVREKDPDFERPSKTIENTYRNVPTILNDSIHLSASHRRRYGRYKLIIDESEDESAVRLLFQNGILDSNPNKTSMFRMSDFTEDIDNELRNVEILSDIKLCMETGKTILMINTGRIHGALYDVFNQNFSIMATDDARRIFSKVAIGPRTVDVSVNEDFQCIVHVTQSEFDKIPAPFRSRFQKYRLSIHDFYHIEFEYLPEREQTILKTIEERAQSFIEHFETQYFYGLNKDTLYSILLSLIKTDENKQRHLVNIQQNYSQLSIRCKSFIEEDLTNTKQCLLRFVLSNLLQLVSPESMILKLTTFENKISQWICQNYFRQQEHFNIENFIIQLLSTQTTYDDQDFVIDQVPQKRERINRITKVVIFTRTTPYIIGLSSHTKGQLFTSNKEDNFDQLKQRPSDITKRVDILNFSTIDNSIELKAKIDNYEHNTEIEVLIIIIDAKTKQQRVHIPYIRQVIEKSDQSYNTGARFKPKHYLLLIHSPPQDLYHHSSFPTIFLNNWDFYFFDISTKTSTFHLNQMIKMMSSFDEKQREPMNNELYNFNELFDECLWDFCSRIQIFVSGLSESSFNDTAIFQFYQRGTNITKRIQCLKTIIQKHTELQKSIINLYQKNLIMKKNLSHQIYSLIYNVSKEILSGRRFTGLVDSIQYQIGIPFKNFVCNILKFIIDDYGLESLSNMNSKPCDFSVTLSLIDISIFTKSNDFDLLSSDGLQETFQVNMPNVFVPETLLFNLLQQRIKGHIDNIKTNLVEQEKEHKNNNDHLVDYPSEIFRRKLIDSMIRDNILCEYFSPNALNMYLHDLLRTVCSIADKNFKHNIKQTANSIEFLTNWLLMTNDNDYKLQQNYQNKNIWCLAHVHTALEYKSNDLFSIYSACRVVEHLEQIYPRYNNDLKTNQLNDIINHLNEEEQHNPLVPIRKLFKIMFNYLWKTLCMICKNDEDSQPWIHFYNFIFTYYPSGQILDNIQSSEIERLQIEFMNFAYLIFLNEKTPRPKNLILNLLNETKIENSQDNINADWSEILPKIMNYLHEYFSQENADASALMIDLLRWTTSTVTLSVDTSKEKIIFMLKYVNQPNNQWSLAIKQFVFDELMTLSIQENKSDEQLDCIDHIAYLVPIVFSCLTDKNIDTNYELPYHPSVVPNNNEITQRPIILDLLFFYLKQYSSKTTITCEIITKITHEPIELKIRDRDLKASAQTYVKQLKMFFSIEWMAIFICENNQNEESRESLQISLNKLIANHLAFNEQNVTTHSYLHLFLSIIISKKSWNFLLDLLQSEIMRHEETIDWANRLYDLLKVEHKIQKYIESYNQIQFTLPTVTHLSNFPKFHQPYDEISQIIDQCIQDNTRDDKWKNLSDWIQTKQNTDEDKLTLREIKVMLLLKIYYDYYCSNRLTLIDSLLDFIQDNLEPSSEELKVLRVLLKPNQFMIGYPDENDEQEHNSLNNLFKVTCNEVDELDIRHSLVNLMAMILLGGEQSFLWTFAFKPLSLLNTYGIGSTSNAPITQTGVHYDCGCVLTENGDLVHFTGKVINALDVPAVYVAYFSTFGAMAWHLLLYDTSVDNLHDPVLAKHAVGNKEATGRMAGDDIRSKVCHFVRARLLSTFHFLSIRSNVDEACILLNHCFEKLAFLTVNHQQTNSSWIKSVYQTLDDQHDAEKLYADQVFYSTYKQLPKWKSAIDDLCLKTGLQMILRKFLSQMPIDVQISDFKAELNKPEYSQLSLNVLRLCLNSSDLLQMTKHIHDLTKFYVLLHQNYAKLIEQSEFHDISLNDLCKRGKKHYRNVQRIQAFDEYKSHEKIIDYGMKAVNEYHKFADGYIRPGACDETQHFLPIDETTSISYLVTTDNHDESDIILRILSVLVDYHNLLLDILERDMNAKTNNNLTPLHNLVNELTTEEVSILQILSDSNGIITLNDQDQSYIKKLCRASLISQENGYFSSSKYSLIFDFNYVQSYIIRKHFLHRRINYESIHKPYQCYVKRKNKGSTTLNDIEMLDLDEKYTVLLTEQQLEVEWNHLKEMSSDKLYFGYCLFKPIILILKDQEDDRSDDHLYDFIDSIGDNDVLRQQLEQYEVKNFKLCHIDHVRKLYELSIKSLESLFPDVSPLLRVLINPKFDFEFVQMLQDIFLNITDDNPVDRINENIRVITNFLNELKEIEEGLLQQSSQSLSMVCESFLVESSLIGLIPASIKCENYVAVNIHLIKIRSTLLQQLMDINEKENKTKLLWQENLDVNIPITIEQHQNCYQNLLNEPDYPSIDVINDDNDVPDIWYDNPIDIKLDPIQQNAIDLLAMENDSSPEKTPIEIVNNKFIYDEFPTEELKYSSLFRLAIEKMPVTTSNLTQQIHNREEKINDNEQTVSTKAQKFLLKHPDGKTIGYLCKSERLYEQFRKVFKDKNYQADTLTIIDKDRIFIDFMDTDKQVPHPIVSEYEVIEKTSLIEIQFSFREEKFNYFVMPNAGASTIINRFLLDNNLKISPETYLIFSDDFGKCIDGETITDITTENRININVTEANNNDDFLCQVTVYPNQGDEKVQLFTSMTTLEQINQWLKTIPELIQSTANDFVFIESEQKIIVNDQQLNLSTIISDTSITYDGIDRSETVQVTIMFDTYSQTICALKSIPVSGLLLDKNLLENLHVNANLDQCVLILEDSNEQLTREQMTKTISKCLDNEDQSLRVRISLLIQITKEDTNEQITIPVSSKNVTIEELLHLTNVSTDVYKYLASNTTKCVLSKTVSLSTLDETKFILAKENEICLVSIKSSNETQLIEIEDEAYQDELYINCAQISDIYQHIKLNINYQFLIYENDFIPSLDTSLASFLPESPIKFSIAENNFPLSIKIINDELSVKLNCFPSVTIQRLHQIACQLLHVKPKYYQFMQSDCVIDYDLSLEDIVESETEIELQLVSNAILNVSIQYQNQTVTFPCDNDSELADIVNDALVQLQNVDKDIDLYEMIVRDEETETVLPFDTKMEDILSLFSSNISTVPLELRLKQNTN